MDVRVEGDVQGRARFWRILSSVLTPHRGVLHGKLIAGQLVKQWNQKVR
jgi:hypothetical protein